MAERVCVRVQDVGSNPTIHFMQTKFVREELYGIGDYAKDTVTGFEGYIIATAAYLTGCDRVLLQPKCEGKITNEVKESYWFDDTRILVATNVAPLKLPTEKRDNGADKDAPKI